MIWLAYAAIIALFVWLFLVPGVRLLTDRGFRAMYLTRRRRQNERLGRVLPRIADWIRITDIWGLRAEEPDDLRSVGWLFTFIGSAAVSGLVVGLIATAKK